MNVYCEMLLERIRIKIDGDETAFQTTTDFYNTKMSKASLIASRLKNFVLWNKDGLSLLDKIKYPFEMNRVFILVNRDVQEKVTIRQIHDFATQYLDGKTIYIIPKPDNFDSSELEHIERIRTEYINGRQHGDTAIAKLKALAQPNRLTEGAF